MRLVIRIFISIVVGLLSAGLGWLTAGLVGLLMEHISTSGEQGDLGLGLIFATLLYVLAFLFGVTGFVLCMVWLSKRRARIPR